MKRFFLLFNLLFIFVSSLSAYVDMSNQIDRAFELNMSLNDYVFSMSIAGLLSGTLLGLFLWKTK